MTTLVAHTFATALGPFSVAINPADSTLVATAFGPLPSLRTRLPETCHLISDKVALASVVQEQIMSYFSGKSRVFDLPLAPVGTPFQHRVWAALRAIPFGETRSYGDLARDLASSARAIGRANATNPICLIVPCHRVIGADGSLTGFAFGHDIKRRLLAHEGVTSPDWFPT